MKTYQFNEKGSEIQVLLNQVKNKTLYNNATTEASGLMSADDKNTLNTLYDNVGENIQQINELNAVAGGLDTRLSDAEETLANIFQLDANNFMGIYADDESLPQTMEGAGWALVGEDLTELYAYVWNISEEEWQQFGETTYDYSDYSGLASKIGDLTQLETEDKTDLVSAINEVKEGMEEEIGTFTDGRTTTVCQSIEDLEAQEPSGGGLSSAAIALLSSILNAGLYGSDQNDNIASLIEELSSGGGGSLVAAPTITVSSYMVSMSAETGNNIYYTIDGSRPSSSSTLYTEPFQPEEDCTIKAVAYNSGSKSAIVSFEYTAYVIDYIVFQDPAVETAALAAFDINGDGVIKLEEARNVTSLSAMTFPSAGEYFNELKYFTSVTAIPNKFFMTSTSGSNVLKEVTLPQSIRSIGTNAAYQQFGITKFLLNEGLQTVGNSAFINCYNVVQSGAMPSTITTIGSSAFEKNRKAAWDTLPPGIVSIGNKAFNDTAVSFDSIPSTLTTIGDSAFEISSVAFSSIPDTVTSIGSAAFRSTNVTFTEMPAAMNDVHFKGCTGITVFTVREGITVIPSNAFMNCSNLTNVTLPSTITSIGQWAFANCSKLASLTITATTPPTLYDGGVFPSGLKHIYVPAESVDTYKAAEYWSNKANYIYAIE